MAPSANGRPDPVPEPAGGPGSADVREETARRSRPAAGPGAGAGAPRLDLLKALGDNTRYAIYLELARSALPLATADVADSLGLHVNTVRPHLERMREIGLLEVQSDPRGSVGRPQHRYSPAPDAPSLGLEPPSFPVLAAMLVRAATLAGVGAEDATEAGRAQGRVDAGAADEGSACLDALVAELDRFGFDPTVAAGAGTTTVAFAHCPFRELAEANPDLVCSLHRGLVEGFVEGFAERFAQGHAERFAERHAGGDGRPGTGAVDAAPGPPADPVEVRAFRPLVHRHPCQVDLAAAGPR